MFKAIVLCLASDSEQAQRIATGLKEAGFRCRDISVVLREPEISGRGKRGANGDAVVGGLAWLAETGQLAIPGIGLLIASGPIMAAMAGAAVVGSPTGGMTEALTILGMPAHQAGPYAQHLNQGQVLMCVRTDGSTEAAAAMEIFIREGAQDIVDIEDGYHGYNRAA